MKKTFKKALAVIIAIVLALGIYPVSFASDDTIKDETMLIIPITSSKPQKNYVIDNPYEDINWDE